MNTPAMQSEIDYLDLAFQKLSGVHFKARGLITGREEGWVRFVNAGFTAHDLETVILWLKGRIRQGKRDIGCLRWSSLIGAPERFDEELALCLAEKRNRRPAPTPKERVLAQARPMAVERVQTQENVRTVSEVIAAMREAAR